MKPIEVFSSRDGFTIYLRFHTHRYILERVTAIGAEKLSSSGKKDTYKIDTFDFLNNLEEFSKIFNLKLDDFLRTTELRNITMAPPKVFDMDLVEPEGILPHITPKPYQLEGFSHAIGLKKSLVALPVGAGKSLCGKMFKEKIKKNVLLICPASIKYQWKKEIMDMTGKEALVIDHYNPEKRKKMYSLMDQYEWTIVNYEQVLNDFEHIKQLDAVIIDEAQYLKNPLSKRTLACAKYALNTEWLLLLSGTPLVNSLSESWTLIKMMRGQDLNAKIGTKGNVSCYPFKVFKDSCFVLDEYDNPVAFREEIIPFKNEIRKKTYYKEKEEIMKHLPEKTEIAVDLKMGEMQNKIYKKVKQGILLDLKDPDKSKQLTSQAIFLRLRQGALDPRLVLKDEKVLDSIKIKWIENFLDSFEERTLIIYSQFDQFLHLLQKELPDYPWVHINGSVSVKDRETLIEGARTSSERSFFLITDAVKVGKNIQFCQHMIFATLPLTFADYDQIRGRIWREGQKLPVTIWRLMIQGSIDYEVWDMIENKRELMEDYKTGEKVNNRTISARLISKYLS